MLQPGKGPQAMTAFVSGAQRRKVPVMLQMEAAECGAICLAMVLAAFGRWETLDDIRDSCGVSRDGTSADSLIAAARDRGLKADAFSRDIDDLGALPLPQILYWGFDHFVVLEAAGRDRFTIIDPAHGRRVVDRAEFSGRFTGITLTFEPGPDFQRSARPHGTLRRLVAMLRGSADMFASIIVTSLAMVMIGVLVPGLTRIFVDDYVVQGFSDWLTPLLAGLLAIGILQSLLALLYVRGMLLLQTKVTLTTSARFVWRLFALPYEFFVRRSPVEVSGRAQLAANVANTVSGPVAQAAVNVLALVGYTVIMLLFSVELTIVVLVLAVIEIAVLHAVTKKIQEQAIQVQMVAAQAHSAVVQGAALLEQARAIGGESVLFNRMMQAETALINVEQSSGRTMRILSALPYAMSRVTTLAVLGMGAWMIIGTDTLLLGSEMTLGTLLGFLMLTALFSSALGALTGIGTAIGQTAGALSRLGDALETGDAHAATPTSASEAVSADIRPVAPTGGIMLRDVCFSYRNGSPILSGIDLTIEPGTCIGVMGASGSGKSTLARVLPGLVQPTRGQLLYEGEQDGAVLWTPTGNGIAFVDQTPFFAGGSLRAALTCWNTLASDKDIESALADAEIAEVVAGRAGGLDGAIGEGGRGFSGGERQRLAIARALIDAPNILVLDDSTSALDEATEVRLLENIRRRGITVVLLTNRASAISHLDRAVVLHDGRLFPVSIEDARSASRASRMLSAAAEHTEEA